MLVFDNLIPKVYHACKKMAEHNIHVKRVYQIASSEQFKTNCVPIWLPVLHTPKEYRLLLDYLKPDNQEKT